jgi:hypothetical protein
LQEFEERSVGGVRASEASPHPTYTQRRELLHTGCEGKNILDFEQDFVLLLFWELEPIFKNLYLIRKTLLFGQKLFLSKNYCPRPKNMFYIVFGT